MECNLGLEISKSSPAILICSKLTLVAFRKECFWEAWRAVVHGVAKSRT